MSAQEGARFTGPGYYDIEEHGPPPINLAAIPDDVFSLAPTAHITTVAEIPEVAFAVTRGLAPLPGEVSEPEAEAEQEPAITDYPVLDVPSPQTVLFARNRATARRLSSQPRERRSHKHARVVSNLRRWGEDVTPYLSQPTA